MTFILDPSLHQPCNASIEEQSIVISKLLCLKHSQDSMDPKTGKHSVLDTLTSCLIIYKDGNDIGKDNEAGVPQILINFHFTFTLFEFKAR